MILRDLPVPEPPEWRVDWDSILRRFAWLGPLEECEQDPIHHAEGDVLVHTRMVAEAMAGLDEWRVLEPVDRDVLFLAALFHDVAKPECTKRVDDQVTAAGHSTKGSIRAREILWREELPFPLRERVTGLVRHHQVPFNAIEMEPRAAEMRVILASMNARCDHLAILARADGLGRLCADQRRVLDNVSLFEELCRENRCLTGPREFPSEHARFLYFRDGRRSPDAPGYGNFRGEVIVMSGLPGSGKSHWIGANAASTPLVSLDGILEKLDLDRRRGMGKAVSLAKEAARAHMRRGETFVWNATNTTRMKRSACIQLFAEYDYRIRIVYVEAPARRLYEQNASRDRVVPTRVIERLIRSWEIPDLTEAHAVDVIVAD